MQITVKKELETIRMSQEKAENPFVKMKSKLKAMNSRMNNAEECISDLEDTIMEITQSEQQTKSQILKRMKILQETYGIDYSVPIYT